jgi:hypothetical protein
MSALPFHEKAGRCQPVFWVIDDRYPDSAVDEDFKSTVNLLWESVPLAKFIPHRTLYPAAYRF